MSKRRRIDWEAIEREYRVGQLSIREIARQFQCTDGAIRHHAKTKGWHRDLTGQVRIRVQGKMLRDDLRTPNAQEEVAENELVEAAAIRGATIIRIHRKDIREGQALVRNSFAQLSQCVNNRHEIEKDIVEETKNDKGVQNQNRMLRAVSLPTNAGVLRDLSVALKNLIALERQAYNLDDDQGVRINDLLGLIAKKNPQVADRVVELLRDDS